MIDRDERGRLWAYRPTEDAAETMIRLEDYARRHYNMPRAVIAMLRADDTFVGVMALIHEVEQRQGRVMALAEVRAGWTELRVMVAPRRAGRPRKKCERGVV